MTPWRWITVLPLGAALALLVSCGGPDRDPSIGEAYVGPATAGIRSDLSLRSNEVATGHHGEKVEILAKRRRMIKVRNSAGVEGWIDSRQLLSSEEMEEFQRLNTRARAVQSQGKAIADDALNVHTVPNRQSPSVFQLEAKVPVDVVAGTRAAKVNFESRLKLRSLAPPVRPPSKKKAAPAPEFPPPPPGPPPALVANWLELSGNPQLRPLLASSPRKTAARPAEPPAVEDWLLVRDPKGRAGWVLTRLVFMTVPDEVAQYAERARIVAFFPLPHSEVREGKPAWLWATVRHLGEDYQFDSVRLFSYSTRRKRYETAFIERDLQGYMPLQVSASATGSRFSYVFESEPGKFVRKEYDYQGVRPRLVQRSFVPRPESIWLGGEAGDDPENQPDSPEPRQGWWRRLRDWVGSLRSR
jgi:hypothetical protein